MNRVARFAAGLFASVWLHGGLFAVLMAVAPYLALLDPRLAPAPETEGPVAVTAEFAVDGDLTASEDTNPDATVGSLTTTEEAPRPPAEEVVRDTSAPKAEPQRPPKDRTPGTDTPADRQGADQRQAKGPPNNNKNKPPCPEVEEVVQMGPTSWTVEREFVDYYASHLAELMKLAGTYPHEDAQGRPDGFRVGLPRCSVLRRGGLKSGDVIHDVNGIRINTVLQAVAAWFDLRNDSHVTVNLTRGGKRIQHHYEVLPRAKRKK